MRAPLIKARAMHILQFAVAIVIVQLAMYVLTNGPGF
jgi:hypothetical protein